MEKVNTRLYVASESAFHTTTKCDIVELVESVEFKSLPSGLHHVKEDLVYVHTTDCSKIQSKSWSSYFIHDEEYAGVSAFANETSAETDRNALMLSVGALIPLSFGRMGKSWKHAEGLIGLAR